MRRWIMDKAVVLGCFYGTNIQFQKSFRVFLTICLVSIFLDGINICQRKKKYIYYDRYSKSKNLARLNKHVVISY